MKAPGFWYAPPGLAAALLSPLACLYALGARRRQAKATPQGAGIPVICVGNLVAGGAGKTPLSQTVMRHLRARGVQAHYLSRGYGGQLKGPLRVDPGHHAAADVGDEPLLLSRTAPAWISADRLAGARAARDGGAQAVVMDDGFQNPALAKDLSLLVVDGGAGFGNGHVIPAGPLREVLGDGLARADAVVIVGADRTGAEASVAKLAPALPILAARLVPDATVAAGLADRPVLAFAGIGRPGKFFDTCVELGLTVAEAVPFPDHHPYAEAEIARLLERAATLGAVPLTTEKDWVRLPAAHQTAIKALPVALAFDDPGALERVLETVS
ncbi:tetraacyldisaccharide 4'-kinase [Nitrospirillum sp. BR 11163]|uniref:tetraacyldisaccharide 4'-kinase n=1 Tax=Nitrospirillum sp. BR 11163 TaxID=3104323 RepID=UPI002AFF89CC|nr:tetraacyldisaccharide 4'-kinase [Nitrospirillum sp. BR 11163]MEA1677117.1 tetraacyldisaccharide 4'-kinase [Nitrospirillum sp. BR 11163]